jgi:hypothetical protein
MPEEMIVRHCSPTLAGIKTGNLFSCNCASTDQLASEVRDLNKKLVPKGLRIIPLRVHQGRALIYVYRPSRLKTDLLDMKAKQMLEDNGYLPENADLCVIHLMQRLQHEETFPHEIGLFLSYPPEDVYGFIEHHADGCKCVGCWKVYGDEEAARRTFEQYEKCTRIYWIQWEHGRSIERLTVAG